MRSIWLAMALTLVCAGVAVVLRRRDYFLKQERAQSRVLLAGPRRLPDGGKILCGVSGL